MSETTPNEPIGDSYEDSDCEFLGGDPRFDPVDCKCTIRVNVAGVEIETPSGSFKYGPRDLLEVVYDLLSNFGPGNSDYDHMEKEMPEALEEALTDEDFLRKTQKPGVRIRIRDPEGILPAGFELSVRTKTEYIAKVLEKRIQGVLPASDRRD